MKTLSLSLFVLVLSASLQAQEWKLDFESAKQKAKTDQKNIVLVFSGSDWCTPCIKLERYIWESEVFMAYAKEDLVLLKADFPRKKANKLSKEQQVQNDLLAERYNTTGYFPLVVILDADGKVLGKTGYKNVTPEAYIKLLQSFMI